MTRRENEQRQRARERGGVGESDDFDLNPDFAHMAPLIVARLERVCVYFGFPPRTVTVSRSHLASPCGSLILFTC